MGPASETSGLAPIWGGQKEKHRAEKVSSFFGLSWGEKVKVGNLWPISKEDLKALCVECEWLELCRQ